MDTGKPMACARLSASKGRHCVPRHRRLRSSYVCRRKYAIIRFETRLCLSTSSVLLAGEVLTFTSERASSSAILLLYDFFWLRQW